MVKLGDIATYINGHAFKPSDWDTQGLPIIRIQNLSGSRNDFNYYNKNYDPKYEINTGDILISWSASLGVYKWNKGKALLNQHIFKVVFDKLPVYKDYFIFAVQYILKSLEAETHGSTMKHITKPRFDNAMIPYPPLDEQKQIAKTLDIVSEMLTMRKQQLAELDNLIKSVFYDMFGDPLINDKGWNLVTLGEIGTFKNGMNYSIIDSGFNMRCLGVGDFKDLYYIKDMSKLSFIGFSEPPSQEYLLKNGDIVFVRSNGNKDLIGRSIEIFPGEEKVTFSGFCIRYRITNACLNSCYLNHVLHVPSLRKKLLKDGRGCNIQNLNQQMLSALLVPVPPIEHQNRFVSIVNKIEDQKSLVKKSIEETQLLFDSLMSQYFDE